MLPKKTRLLLKDYFVFTQILGLMVLILVLYIPLMGYRKKSSKPILGFISFVKKIEKKLS